LKILLISSEFPPGPGGIGRHAFSLIKALRGTHSLSVISNQDWAEEDEKNRFLSEEMSGVYFKRLVARTIPLYKLWRIFQVIWFTIKLKPDHVILTGKYSLWMGYMLKKLGFKAKTVGFIHGTEVGNLKSDKLTQKSLNTFDKIIPVSNFTASLITHFIKDGSKVQVIPNGVDADFLDLASQSTQPWPWGGNPETDYRWQLNPAKRAT
jgi:phosphatidylinositol alpha-1,6-mannosyltransferase